MTNQERIEKYVKEHCSKCKNKTECEIRVNEKGNAQCATKER